MVENQRDLWAKLAIISIIIVPILTLGLTWFLTERIRTQISQQTLVLENRKTIVSERTVDLDRIKTVIADSALKLDDARTEIAKQMLDLERARIKIMESNRKTEELTLKLNQSRLEFDQTMARNRSAIEDTKLAPEFAQILSDIRPNIEIKCSILDKSEIKVIRLKCVFSNKGKHLVVVNLENFKMIDGFSQKEISGAIAGIENNVQNNILPYGSGSDIYVFRLTERGSAQNKNQQGFYIHFLVKTDKTIIDQLKSSYKDKKYIRKINDSSSQGYNYKLF